MIMASGNIKLPLSSFGFPFLCGFIGLIHNGLGIVSQSVDANAAEITALENEIRAGEVAALCATRGGDVIATRGGVEIQAVRIL